MFPQKPTASIILSNTIECFLPENENEQGYLPSPLLLNTELGKRQQKENVYNLEEKTKTIIICKKKMILYLVNTKGHIDKGLTLINDLVRSSLITQFISKVTR